MSRPTLTKPRLPVDPIQATGLSATRITNTSGNYRMNTTAAMKSSRMLTISFWIRNRGTANVNFVQSNTGRFINRLFGTGSFFVRFDGYSAAAALVARIDTGANSIPADDAWHHVLISLHTGLGVSHAYVDDVSSVGASTAFSSTNPIDFTDTTVLFGNTTGNNFDIAEYLFMPGYYFDFSKEKSRRRFIQANGKPSALGQFGHWPVKNKSPYIYLTGGASSFFTNNGEGPAFTNNSMTPAPSDAPTVP